MRRVFVAFVALCCTTCHPPPQVRFVNAIHLYSEYRNSPEDAERILTGQWVEFTLVDHYTTEGDTVCWWKSWPPPRDYAPAVVCQGIRPPGGGPITIRGRCLGVVRDGRKRAPGRSWDYGVVVADCSIR